MQNYEFIPASVGVPANSFIQNGKILNILKNYFSYDCKFKTYT